MLEKLLHNHASLPQYLKRLDHWHTMEAAKNKRRQHNAMQKANKPGEESNEDSGKNGTSSESESGDDNKATCYAFTCAALQEMDDTNMKEWKTHQKIQRLMGVAGVQRAARAILRQEREGRHKKNNQPERHCRQLAFNQESEMQCALGTPICTWSIRIEGRIACRYTAKLARITTRPVSVGCPVQASTIAS